MNDYTNVIQKKIEFVISIFEKIGAQQIELKKKYYLVFFIEDNYII